MSEVEWTLHDGGCARVHSVHLAYGFQDSKGREVGCILFIYDWHYGAIIYDWHYGAGSPDNKIEGYLHSARDGAAFGPILSRTFRKYDTIEQAKEDVLKRALRAREKAVKKHQKQLQAAEGNGQ